MRYERAYPVWARGGYTGTKFADFPCKYLGEMPLEKFTQRSALIGQCVLALANHIGNYIYDVTWGVFVMPKKNQYYTHFEAGDLLITNKDHKKL